MPRRSGTVTHKVRRISTDTDSDEGSVRREDANDKVDSGKHDGVTGKLVGRDDGENASLRRNFDNATNTGVLGPMTSGADAPSGADEAMQQTQTAVTFESRVGPDGIYDWTASQLLNDPSFIGHPSAFEGVNIKKDRNGNIQFFRAGAAVEYISIGEIGDREQGTLLSALGDKVNAPKDVQIDLTTRIRQRYAFRHPTMSTMDIREAWEKQEANLQAMIMLAEGGQAVLDRNLNSGKLIIDPFMKPVRLGGDPEALQLVTDSPIYEVVPQTSESVFGKKRPRGGEAKKTYPGPELSLETARALEKEKVTLHTRYHASALADHTGERFSRHHAAKLIQQDIRDINGNLVVPWEVGNVLRPGTLCMATVTPRMYEMTDADSREKHYYRLNVKKLLVLAESPERPEPIDAHSQPTPVRDSQTSARFDGLAALAKKLRTA